MPNPCLPFNEFIPDAEPHIFDGRVYLYGSHDNYNDLIFCTGDYVTYSADVNDLSSFRYEGVIYKAKQDPLNRFINKLLFAPDIVRGDDGNYYLYYGIGFTGIMGVAKASSPIGPFEFYGHLKHPDGKTYGRKKGDANAFDPSVILDNGKVYVFFGFGGNIPSIATGLKTLKYEGCYLAELKSDNLTIAKDPQLVIDKNDRSFFGHEFFEASSIRKYGETYYLTYSSKNNHELCYATAGKIEGPYSFKGTLVDIGDCYLKGRQEKDALNYLGNTHGGMFEVNGKYYQMYHRHNNRHGYSRCAMVEQLEKDENGDFVQAEVTSLGFEDIFDKKGEYSFYYACTLMSKSGTGRYDIPFSKLEYASHPAFVLDKETGVIDNFSNGCICGFKYFSKNALNGSISIVLKGKGKGQVEIADNIELENAICINVDFKSGKYVETEKVDIVFAKEEKNALYFRYVGQGKYTLRSFILS